ncbi:sigma-70 family RNA polymerase sigma factor [Haliangium sp.]|uniref:sigma-70 family RNA polymerase sigma factor n=1 Tax=Haliangium sp. TaxID=2663208 RepID=UPI003D0967EC
MARYVSEEPGFQAFVEAVERFPVLSREDELALATRWRRDGERPAADALVQSHLRSVVKLALKYRGYGIYLSDLVAEGNLGLLEAVERFEPERGLRFFTYARHWVRAFMLAHVLKHWSIVDLGTTALQSKMFFRLQAEHARLMATLGESDETIEGKLADKFQTSREQVRTSLQRLGRRDASLDAPVLDGSITFLDTLQDTHEDQESQIAAAQLSSVVRAAVEEIWPTLDCRERLIVDNRLLPADGDSKTLASLGRQLGITRERVRQLEAGVKSKLRTVLDRMLAPTAAEDVETVRAAAA